MSHRQNTAPEADSAEPFAPPADGARWLSGAHLAHLIGLDPETSVAEAVADDDARRLLTTYAHRVGLDVSGDTPLGDLDAVPVEVAHHLGQEPTRAEVIEWADATLTDDPAEIGDDRERIAAEAARERRVAKRAAADVAGSLRRASANRISGDTLFPVAEVERVGDGAPWAVQAIERWRAANRVAWRSRGGDRFDDRRRERYGVTAAELIACGAEATQVAAMTPMTADDLDRAVLDVALAREADRLELRREAARLEAEHAAADVAIPGRIDLATYEPDPTPWVVDRLISRGAVLGLFAERKAGKTTVVRELVRAAVDGDKFLGEFGVVLDDGATVVVLDTEMPVDTLHREYTRAGVKSLDRLDLRSLRGIERALDARTEAVRARWRREIAPGSLIVVDCLYTLFGALGVSENSDEVVSVLAGLRSLATECDAAGLVVVHHLGKDTDKGARGHSGIESFPDAIARIELDGPPSPETLRVFSAYGRDGVNVDRGLLTLGDDHRLALGADPKHERAVEKRNDDNAATLALIEAHPGKSTRTLSTLPAEARGNLSRDRIRAAVARLSSTNRIANTGTEDAPAWHVSPGVDPAL